MLLLGLWREFGAFLESGKSLGFLKINDFFYMAGDNFFWRVGREAPMYFLMGGLGAVEGICAGGGKWGESAVKCHLWP